jgi:4-hydroxyproline epimerase
MCGHGTIGTVTVAIEQGLVVPKTPGVLRLEVPAGLVLAYYELVAGKVAAVRIVNVASYLHSTGLTVECPELGQLTVDVAYGGNYYAIVDAQENFRDMADLTAADLVRLSPVLRQRLNEQYTFTHPENPSIGGLSHILWTGAPRHAEATARNAVFYGDKAIDRSPCGTGTSSRMAQWAAQGKLAQGDDFVHESIIGSLFRGRVEGITAVADYPAIIPSVAGWAKITGFNTIFINDDDPYKYGFQVI